MFIENDSMSKKYYNIGIVQWKYGSFVRYSSIYIKCDGERKLFFLYEVGEEEIFMFELSLVVVTDFPLVVQHHPFPSPRAEQPC